MRDPHADVVKSERGATAVEYSLLLAMIAGVIIAVVIALGTNVIPLYDLTF